MILRPTQKQFLKLVDDMVISSFEPVSNKRKPRCHHTQLGYQSNEQSVIPRCQALQIKLKGFLFWAGCACHKSKFMLYKCGALRDRHSCSLLAHPLNDTTCGHVVRQASFPSGGVVADPTGSKCRHCTRPLR
jgi:hypothetical protein